MADLATGCQFSVMPYKIYVTAMLAIMLAATLAFKINNTSDSLGS